MISDKEWLFLKNGLALDEPKKSSGDPHVAVGAVVPLTDFALNVTEASQVKRPESFNPMSLGAE